MPMQLGQSDVVLIRWPAESARRDRYRDQGLLRLLVLEGGVAPPICSDIREDWVRAPVSKEDLMARVAALRAKSDGDSFPRIDPNGVLRFRSRSIVLSPTETTLLELLALSFGEVVAREVLLRELPKTPTPTRKHRRNALDLHIMRIRRRIKPLSLAVRTAWGRGYVLVAIDPELDADEFDISAE